MWCWEHWTVTCKNEVRKYTHIIHKNRLKGVKDLNISQDIIKLLEENTGKTFFDISFNSV